jgi:hypothetical protein
VVERQSDNLYTIFPWPALCTEVAKLRIDLREGKVIEDFCVPGGGDDDTSGARFNLRLAVPVEVVAIGAA